MSDRLESTMKLLLSAVFVVIASAADITSVEWEQYKANHRKVYTSAKENAERLAEYLKNKKIIEEHNRKFQNGETSYKMAVNKFADWFPEELDKVIRVKMDEKSGPIPSSPAPDTAVPSYVNWVRRGAVTKVKDQKDCSSGYAFSAAGALEGLSFIKNQTISDLSSQELIDCSFNFGCMGGRITNCFSYVAQHGGISTNDSYPYEAEKGRCRADKGKRGASCTSWKQLAYSEIHLQNAVAMAGPVSISFAASNDFFFYNSGVFDGPCSTQLNHAMLAVGYGRIKKSDTYYWLVKNSWGTDWGRKGYAKVKRGQNLCEIALRNSYPVDDTDHNI